jgi:hypothetical protein
MIFHLFSLCTFYVFSMFQKKKNNYGMVHNLEECLAAAFTRRNPPAIDIWGQGLIAPASLVFT